MKTSKLTKVRREKNTGLINKVKYVRKKWKDTGLNVYAH